MSKNGGRRVAKEIAEVTRANESKKVNGKYWVKNKLIIFTYYLKLFLTLSYIIKLVYKTYLIYLIT